ncbi:MAG: ABC transporter substrate-binding protein [Clostridiales bacterium]
MKKKLLLVLCCVFALVAFTACGGGGKDADTAKNDGSTVTVAMGVNSEPTAGFDTSANWGCAEHCHEPLIQSTLVNTDKDMNIVNDLATEYGVSDDLLTWTFKIRDDVKFTDGEALTAKDVAFTFNTIKNSKNSELDLEMMDKAVAVDNTTVELQLNKPFNALLYSVAVVGIMPEHAYGKDYAENPIGSGRYMLEQWDKGQQIILKANPDYYGEAPKMKKVIVVFMAEDAALAAAKKGEVDIAYTAATYSDQKIDGYKLEAVKSVDSRGISLPTEPAGGTKTEDDVTYKVGNNVTSDLAIRQAMNYAVDREAMMQNVLNGYGTVAYSVSDGMPWSSPDMKVETDVEKAKTILKDGGWVDGDGDGILEKDGQKAEFTLYYSADDSVRQGIAAEFANQMKNIGINITYKGASWDDLYPHQYSDAVVWGWGANSPAETYNLYYSKGWGNFPCYNSETVDKYLNQALSTKNIEDSYELWQKAQWDGKSGVAPQGAATWVWFGNVDHLYFTREGLNIGEQKLHPHGHGWSLVNNVDTWTWETK